MKLIGYFRSSAAFRVRIALNLKGIRVDHAFRHLRKGEQHAADYVAINPQKLVPALILDSGQVLTQSLAILEYLEEIHPAPPLLPRGSDRSGARALAGADPHGRHPSIQNLRVMAYLREKYEQSEEAPSPGRGTGSRRALLRTRPRWRATPGLACTVMATSRPWPISAWCRRSSMPAASRSICRDTRRCSASSPPA